MKFGALYARRLKRNHWGTKLKRSIGPHCHSVLAFSNFKEAALLFDRVIFPNIGGFKSGSVTYDFRVAIKRKIQVSEKRGEVVMREDPFTLDHDVESIPLNTFF